MRGTVYVGTSLLNADRAIQIMERLKQEDVQISYDWTKHGQVYSKEELRKYGIAEKRGIIECDVFLMVFPARNGSHIELGLALGYDKHVVLLEEIEVEQKTFYHLPGVQHFKMEEEAIQHILKFLDCLGIQNNYGS